MATGDCHLTLLQTSSGLSGIYVKVKLSLCLIRQYAMRLEVALGGGAQHGTEVSDPLHAPALLPSGKDVTRSHWIGGYEERERSCPCRQSNRDSSVFKPLGYSL